MKPKYFPLITLLGAVGLLLLPLGLLLVMTQRGSSLDGELDRQLAGMTAAEQKSDFAPASISTPKPEIQVAVRPNASEVQTSPADIVARTAPFSFMPSPRDAAAPTGGSSTELVPGDELSK